MKRKQYISFVLAVIIVFINIWPIPASALEYVGSLNISDIRLNNVFEDHLDIMKLNTADLYDLPSTAMIDYAIATTSIITDFALNQYTLVECDPTGYMIYHNASGRFVEYSLTIHSPFWGKYGKLMYCGPNEYYISERSTDGYHYIFDSQVLSAEDIAVLVSQSQAVNQVLVENKNDYVLDYINGRSDTRPADHLINKDGNVATLSQTVGSWTYIDHADFFVNLANCGYIDGGICGYIAASMILNFDDIFSGYDTVPDTYHTQISENQYAISTASAAALFERGKSLGYDAGTTSVAIHYTVESWLADREITVDHTSLYIPFGSESTIVSKIRNNRPVIWFGAVSSHSVQDVYPTTGNHAVVVYGFCDAYLIGYDFIAHFGWNNATSVYFSGILGSLYTYEF